MSGISNSMLPIISGTMTVDLVLVGAGKWGRRYIETLKGFSDVNLKIANRDNWRQLIDTKPQGVIVCTPPHSHVEIAIHSLSQNIPTMIEKPLSLSSHVAGILKQFKTPILVNHIHLFSDVYQFIKKTVDDKWIKQINSINYNNGPQRDYSSLWDYGCHDLAMILDLLGKLPRSVSIVPHTTENGELYNINLDFPGGHATHSIVGNGGNERQQTFTVEFDGVQMTYDISKKSLSNTAPLTNALCVFLDAIDGNLDPRLGINLSLGVLEILEKCQQSSNYNH